MKTIGLCMIVKDEATIILRCLASVRALVDYVLIEDTGSTDGTQEIVREYLECENLPGEVYQEPWHDFAFNRTHVLTRLREKPNIDYALFLDADDRLVLEKEFDVTNFKEQLDADYYHVWIQNGEARYLRPQIFRNRVEFYYRGVVYDFLEGPPDALCKTVSGFQIVAGLEGHRSADPQKYLKDVTVLETALETEPDPFLRSRYTFYLAQSHRDAGRPTDALAAYLKRADMGYQTEEVYVSLYCAAQLKEQLQYPDFEVIGYYLKAFEICPKRAEALHDASRYCRIKGKFHQGYLFAKQALDIPVPETGLYITRWIYEYGLLDEFSVNAYWVGNYIDTIKACERLCREGKAPPHYYPRIKMNAELAEQRLSEINKLPAAAINQEPNEAPQGITPRSTRIAVITPYYKEDRPTLERCLRSVRQQILPADHFVIADGFPQAWLNDEAVRHLCFDQAHADYGGCARAVGALLAAAEEYEAIAFLDADNWFEPDHLEHCLSVSRAFPEGICDYVVARSRFVRSDGSPMNVGSEAPEEHADTSCFFFLRGSFHMLPIWALTPKRLSPLGDRFFYRAIRDQGLVRAIGTKVTVNYQSSWEFHFRLLGETPPPDAKPTIYAAPMIGWIQSLPDRERNVLERLMQVNLLSVKLF